MKKKATTNMRRIAKGDVFNLGDETLTCAGTPERVGNGRVKLPVLVAGNTRLSRRTFDGDMRVALR